jgi:hypothetical protein
MSLFVVASRDDSSTQERFASKQATVLSTALSVDFRILPKGPALSEPFG